MTEDADWLNDIEREIEVLAQAYARRGRELLEDPLERRGVLYALQVIGEASKRLSADTEAQAPEVPWKRIRGLRNRIVHEYDALDDDLIDAVLDRDLSILRAAVRRLLDRL